MVCWGFVRKIKALQRSVRGWFRRVADTLKQAQFLHCHSVQKTCNVFYKRTFHIITTSVLDKQ